MNHKPTITVIGAKGNMGKAFTSLFRSHGITVLEADLDTDLTPTKAIEQADITIFSVPISITGELIRELAPKAKPKSLITDLTSIKSPAMAALEEAAPASCEILGLHPMFGPHAVTNMDRQLIVACPPAAAGPSVRSGKWSSWLLKFFKKQGAVIKETTPAEHDNMMSIIQGLTHLSSIATGMALKKLGFSIQDSLQFASPIYRLRLEMVGRILSQSPELYAEIAIENPLTKDSLEAYQDSINLLAQHIQHHDTQAFINDFSAAAEYLGSFTDEAYERTNEIIRRCKDIL